MHVEGTKSTELTEIDIQCDVIGLKEHETIVDWEEHKLSIQSEITSLISEREVTVKQSEASLNEYNLMKELEAYSFNEKIFLY